MSKTVSATITERRDLAAAFRFVIEIDGNTNCAFSECTPPVIEWEVELVKEGGLNTSFHQLPGRRKQATITLKNGVGFVDTLLPWCVSAMHEKFDPRTVTITVQNSRHKPIMVWYLEKAWPIRWTGPQLQSDGNTLVIQTLELACEEISIEGPGGKG